ncbi:hypothetical protein OROGR_005927 [Orobanche gracilis]
MAMKLAFERLTTSEYTTRDAAIRDVGCFKCVELSVLLCNDGFIQKLNKEWRGEDHVTDVLSMSQHIPELKLPILMLGDIVISVETAARQAEERGQSLIDEIRILVVHGLLHLLGFDHELSDEAEKEMENEEVLMLNVLGWKGKGLIHSAYDAEAKGSQHADYADGTFLNSKSQISLSTAEALKEASLRCKSGGSHWKNSASCIKHFQDGKFGWQRWHYFGGFSWCICVVYLCRGSEKKLSNPEAQPLQPQHPHHENLQNLYDSPKPLIWRLYVDEANNPNRNGTLTAFAIGPGLLMTCAHGNWLNYNRLKITAKCLNKEDTFIGSVVAKKLNCDMVMVQIRGEGVEEIEVARLGSGKLEVGETIMAFGHLWHFFASGLVGHNIYPCVDNPKFDLNDEVTCANYFNDSLPEPPICRIMGHVWNADIFN